MQIGKMDIFYILVNKKILPKQGRGAYDIEC
jgi:hypothetical protein